MFKMLVYINEFVKLGYLQNLQHSWVAKRMLFCICSLWLLGLFYVGILALIDPQKKKSSFVKSDDLPGHLNQSICLETWHQKIRELLLLLCASTPSCCSRSVAKQMFINNSSKSFVRKCKYVGLVRCPSKRNNKGPLHDFLQYHPNIQWPMVEFFWVINNENYVDTQTQKLGFFQNRLPLVLGVAAPMSHKSPTASDFYYTTMWIFLNCA